MSDINFKKMVKTLAKNGADIITGLTPNTAHLLHMAVGVQGEIGELIENHLEQGSRENKIEELGDIEFYFEGIATPLAFNFNGTPTNTEFKIVERELLELSASGAALLDAIKKASIYEKQLDSAEVVNQMFLIRQRLCNLYAMFDITHKEAIEANIAKLGKRYSGGAYSNADAQNRADKQSEK